MERSAGFSARARVAVLCATALACLGASPEPGPPSAAAVKTFSIPGGEKAGRIVTGSDGALWFELDEKIGRMTTAGAFTEFPVPTAKKHLLGLTAGPDGALWFGEEGDLAVHRMTTDGALDDRMAARAHDFAAIAPGVPGAFYISEGFRLMLRVLAGDGGPPTMLDREQGAATLGPDGALWVGHIDIDRIDSTGKRTQFSVQDPDFGAATSIANGPDGNLWYTATDADRIGRITPSGAVTEFPIAAFESAPREIVAAPDGALWFLQNNAVGRITTDGVITEYAMPGGIAPGHLTAGNDAAVWFTSGSTIGRLALDAAPVAIVSNENPYLKFASYDIATAPRANGGLSLEINVSFTLSHLGVDPSRLAARMRRVDGSVRPWVALRSSTGAPGPIAAFDIPDVRGATYEFAFEAKDAIVPVGGGPSGGEVEQDERSRQFFPNNPPLPEHNTFLLTVPSAPVAAPDRALALVRQRYANRLARVVRSGVTLFGDYGNPHAPPFSRALATGERIKITAIHRAGAALTSTGALGVAPGTVTSGAARYSASSIRAEVAGDEKGSDPGSCWLYFASVEELELYLRAQ